MKNITKIWKIGYPWIPAILAILAILTAILAIIWKGYTANQCDSNRRKETVEIQSKGKPYWAQQPEFRQFLDELPGRIGMQVILHYSI